MKKKTLGILAMCALAMTLFTGCGKSTIPSDNSSANTAKSDKQLSIGFSAGYSKVQHWNLEILGAQAAANKLGVKFTYQFANGDPQKQVADIENMKQMGINMLIVGPADSKGIVPTVNELQGNNIPVMTSDISITGTKVVANVASDNYNVGVKAADYMGQLLGGKGKIAIVGWQAASATKDREQGFIDTIKSKYPNIIIVANQDVGGSRNTSLAASENIIQANKDINAFFGVNAECALGAYNATHSVNRSDINIIAVDSDSEVMKAIADNTNMKATIAQDPYTMGYQAVVTAVSYLKGEAVKDIAIPTELVTKDNVNEIVQRDQNYLNNK